MIKIIGLPKEYTILSHQPVEYGLNIYKAKPCRWDKFRRYGYGCYECGANFVSIIEYSTKHTAFHRDVLMDNDSILTAPKDGYPQCAKCQQSNNKKL